MFSLKCQVHDHKPNAPLGFLSNIAPWLAVIYNMLQMRPTNSPAF